MAIRIAACALFTGRGAGTGALLGVAAVGGDLPFAGHVHAAESFLAAPSSSTTWPSARWRRRVFCLLAAPSSSTTLPSDPPVFCLRAARRWMAATLDGRVQHSEAVFEAKFMLPWSFSEEAAVAKYMPQLQHNMWVVAARSAVLSVITGGGKWVEITTHADPLFQHLIITAERKFWRCVENGEPPRLFGVEAPRPRVEAVRIVDMSASNSSAGLAGTFRATRSAFLEHEKAKAELKGLMPDDAKEAIGHGVRGKRSKSGAISFDLLEVEGESHAAV
jgi:hypothetical protein